jgi:hypothetical protein
MLTKLRVVPIIVLLLTPIASAFQEPAPAPWRPFNSPEGKFSLLMPTEPKVEVQEVNSPVGKLTLYSYASSSKAAYLLVSYGDYPNEPVDATNAEQVLDDVRAGVLKSIGGEVLSGDKIVLKGRAKSTAPLIDYPGREFVATKTLQGAEVVYNWRLYLVGRRLYQLAVVTKKADATSPDVQKFLTSFQVTN